MGLVSVLIGKMLWLFELLVGLSSVGVLICFSVVVNLVLLLIIV